MFALQTLWRSRPHKLVIGFSVAIALVLALQTAGPNMVAHLRSGESWSIWQLESILAVPLVIGAVLISVLCYVFQLPSQVEASWVFRMAERLGPRELLDSVEYLLVFCGRETPSRNTFCGVSECAQFATRNAANANTDWSLSWRARDKRRNLEAAGSS